MSPLTGFDISILEKFSFRDYDATDSNNCGASDAVNTFDYNSANLQINNIHLDVGDWVSVEQDKCTILGKLTKIENNNCLVSCMENAGLLQFRWSLAPRNYWYCTKSVIKVNVMKTSSKRDLFKIIK